jgi:peptidoglycan/LPS O-acetylase OafA/YrhL
MADFIFGMFLAMVDTWKLDAPLLARLSPERRSFLLHTIFFAGGWVLTHPHRQGDFSWPRKSPGYVWLAAMIPSGYNSFIYYRYWQTWGALLTVYSVLRIDWLEKFFSIPSMRFLGRVSFMLYLTHLIFIRITGDRLHGLLGGPVDDSIKGTFWDNSLWMPDIGPMGLSTRWLTCVILVLPANLLLSKWFTEWIDDTIVNFAKRMTAGIRPPKRAEREGEEGESMLPMSRTRRNSL